MKKKTTMDIIAESFQEIAEQKNVNKITINDIVENCGLSSATFYRYFQDKYDLIAWIYGKRNINTLLTPYSSIHKWVSYCEENKEILLNLMENTNGYQSFIKRMIEIYVSFTEDLIIARSGRDALTDKVHRAIYLRVSGVVLFLNIWLRGDIHATVDEVAETILETSPKSISQLISSSPLPKIR